MAKTNVKKTAKPFFTLILKGVEECRKISILDPNKVNVDNTYYQRSRVPRQINGIAAVIEAGGVIPDPIKVARRNDGTLWVVDGQQRLLAHQMQEVPVNAMIYDVRSMHQEQMLFEILNNHAKVRPDFVAAAWPGPAGHLLRKAGEEGGMLAGLINYGRNASLPFSASLLANGIFSAVRPFNEANRRRSIGKLQENLTGIDQILKQDSRVAADIDRYMQAMLNAYDPELHVPHLVYVAVGYVFSKNNRRGSMRRPLPKTEYMRATNGSASIMTLPSVITAVEDRWVLRERKAVA